MKRICLVNFVPSTDPANYAGYSQGLGVLSALLKKAGHQTTFTPLSAESTPAQIDAAGAGDCIFVYLTTNGFSLFVQVLREHWAGRGIPVFVGGPHAIAMPKEVAGLPGVKGACAGEGELACQVISRWLEDDSVSLEQAPNMVFARNNEFTGGPSGRVVEDLNSLPFPDRTMFPYERVLGTKAGRLVGMEFMATRGCKYGCRFCLNPRLLKVHGKQMMRRRTVTQVIEEVNQALAAFDFSGPVGFHDDIFTLDLEWLAEFAYRFPKEVGRPFWCNGHIRDLDEHVIRTLRQAGCYRILVGIECGNEELRAKALNKRISNEEILTKSAMLHAQHIKIVATFMLGLPDETEGHIEESIALCRAIKPAWVLLSSLWPFPGTRLYDELVEAGRLAPDFYHRLAADTFYAPRLVYQQGPLTQERLTYYYNNFRKLAGVL